MFAGKSNLIDAIAFALCLPLLPAKHNHVRDLVYRAPNGNLESEPDGSAKMYV
jgi:chromosome segregation ATPase